MEPIKYVLQDRVKLLGFQKQVDTALVIERFNQLLLQEFGDLAINRIQAIYIKDAALCVVVLSSPMAQELKFKELKLLESLNGFFGRKVVERVRYMV